MTMTKGASLLGLLGSMLDADGTADLASAVQGLLDFAKADHRWSVDVRVKHDPKREGDD